MREVPHARKAAEDVLERARSLRLNQTDPESLMWLLLRNRRLAGFKFRRQHPVGRYVLGIYCSEARLVVEVDGGQHNDEVIAEQDSSRTEDLKRMGIEVIRFWNHDVHQNTEAVLERIYEELVKRSQHR